MKLTCNTWRGAFWLESYHTQGPSTFGVVQGLRNHRWGCAWKVKSNHHLETICLVIFSQMSPIYLAPLAPSLPLHLDYWLSFFLTLYLGHVCLCVSACACMEQKENFRIPRVFVAGYAKSGFPGLPKIYFFAPNKDEKLSSLHSLCCHYCHLS